MSLLQPDWPLNPNWGSLPRATSCCALPLRLMHFSALSLLSSVPPKAASWAQPLWLIPRGGTACSSHPAD